jgi:hypothetical protein
MAVYIGPAAYQVGGGMIITQSVSRMQIQATSLEIFGMMVNIEYIKPLMEGQIGIVITLHLL